MTKHPDELLVEDLVEAFEADVKLVVEFLSTEGRPIFTQPLTPEQQWAYFSNLATRTLIINDLQAREGPDAVRRYIDSMMALAPKVQAAAQAKMRGMEGAPDGDE